jgi:hypothetical protein
VFDVRNPHDSSGEQGRCAIAALDQRTHTLRQIDQPFDLLVGAGGQRRQHIEAERRG